jgi:Na+-driven multidrug efflux pump
LAIAAQTLVGHRLGAEKYSEAQDMMRLLTRWGLLAGIAVGVFLAAISPLVAALVTSDANVSRALIPVLLMLAVALPIGGPVFVLDGVLMGAGDVVYLAWTGVVNVAVLLPFLWLVAGMAEAGDSVNTAAVVALQASVGLGFLGARWVTLGLRVRGTRWMKGGAHRV